MLTYVYSYENMIIHTTKKDRDMNTIILVIVVLTSSVDTLKTEFVAGCIGGNKATYVCSEKAQRVAEFTQACIGGDKTIAECVDEAVRVAE